MGVIHSEGFESGSLPSGWSSPDSTWSVVGTTDGVTPTGGSYMLRVATLTTPSFFTWATSDGNSGNVTAYVNVNPDAGQSGGNPPTVGVAVRVSATGDSPSCVLARVNLNTGAAAIAQWSSGSESVLASNTPAAAPGGWITLAFTASGTSLSLAIQDIATGKWLDPSGGLYTSASQVNYLTATATLTGAGYWALYGKAPSSGSDAFLDDAWLGTAGSSPSPSVTQLYFADAATTADAPLAASRAPDAATPAEGRLLAALGRDAGLAVESSLAAMGASDAASASSSSILAALAGDAGASDAAATLTTFAGGYIYADDGGSGSEASVRVALVGDASTDAEAFAASLVLVSPDGGLAASAALSIVSTTVSYSTIDGAEGTESAPAPTMWDSDALAGDAAWLVAALGGESGSGGSGFADLGTGSEAWYPSSTLVAADAGSSAAAAWWATLVLACDAATAAELAAIGLVTEGYHIYCSPISGGPIDYGTIVGTNLGLDNTTWTSGTYGPGTWSFGVRAYNDVGEETNVDCVVVVVLDENGNDITSIPLPPTGLRAFPLAGGSVRIEWGYLAGLASETPTGFNVYCTPGDAISYGTPAAVVPYGSSLFGAYSVTIPGLIDEQLYQVAVRSFGGAGEDTNTTTVSVTAEATGPPRPVSMLTGTLTA